MIVEPEPSTVSLTPGQAGFVDEYLADFNAMQASVPSGFAVRGARVQGHRLPRKSKVATAIQREQGQNRGRLQICRDSVLLRLQGIVEEDSVCDRVPALTFVGRILGLTVEKREYSGTIDHNHVYRILQRDPQLCRRHHRQYDWPHDRKRARGGSRSGGWRRRAV